MYTLSETWGGCLVQFCFSKTTIKLNFSSDLKKIPILNSRLIFLDNNKSNKLLLFTKNKDKTINHKKQILYSCHFQLFSVTIPFY